MRTGAAFGHQGLHPDRNHVTVARTCLDRAHHGVDHT